MSCSPLRMTGMVARMGGQAVRNEGTAGNMDGRQATSGWGMPAVSDGLGVSHRDGVRCMREGTGTPFGV